MGVPYLSGAVFSGDGVVRRNYRALSRPPIHHLGKGGGPEWQQKQTFSAQTLTLSVAAAELGRAIFGAGQTGSVRAVLLSNVLAAAAFVLLAALASVNASRLIRPGFAGKCICAVFLLWYLFELVRTAAMLQQTCWEQFASMAFIGLLPFLSLGRVELGCELYDRMVSVLGWLVVLGIVFCVLGLAGQLQWQVLVTGETAHSFVLPDASFYPEYFSFPLLCRSKNNAKISKKPVVWLPIIAAVISSGYALGLALLFGAPQAYPGYELLRAWSFGGISALMPHSCSSGWRRRSSASALSSVLSGCSVSALPKGL